MRSSLKNLDPFDPVTLLILILIMHILITLILYKFAYFERTITVVDKLGYASGKYISNTIVDENGVVYSISNSLPLFYFTSAEVFLQMAKGSQYIISGYGLRIPFLGMFPNILKIRPV